ncbi:MAG: peptidyl-prolyl cis-trans isomerase [Deltaproteobacteria bacterium]|nr:peptidyl-prolyl cis-trans isomerase [Deltaproteobacteria bacterium]
MFLLAPLLAQTQRGQLVARVVAVVNADVILFSQLQRKKSDIHSKKIKLAVEEEALKSNHSLLQLLINDKLLEQSIQSKGIEPSPEDVEMAFQDNLDRLKMNESQLVEGLKKEGSTIPEFKANIKRHMELRRLLGDDLSKKTVSEQDVLNFYRTNPHFFKQGQKYHLKQIFFATEDKLSVAREIVEKIKKGESFESLAQKHSEGQVDLGFMETDQMRDELLQQVSKLKKGEVSPVFKSNIGYHIIKIEDISTSTIVLSDDVKQKIRERLMQENMLNVQQSFIQKRREDSHIKILL